MVLRLMLARIADLPAEQLGVLGLLSRPLPRVRPSKPMIARGEIGT